MRLETLLAVTGGTLLNQPAVSRFDRVTTRLHRVERGTLFVTSEAGTIPQAIARGAYGILTDAPVAPVDRETAWIRVDDLGRALLHLLRLWLVENPRRFLLIDPAPWLFLRQICAEPAWHLLEGDEKARSLAVLESREEAWLVGSDPLFFNHLGIVPEPLRPRDLSVKLLKHSLFTSDLLIEEHYHSDLMLAPCTLTPFRRALAILEGHGARHTLAHLGHTPLFDPLFLSARGNPLPFGGSDRVVIFQQPPKGCRCPEAFAAATWLPRNLYLPKHFKFECAIKPTTKRYDTSADLAAMLLPALEDPGYHLVLGEDRESFLAAARMRGVPTSLHSDKGLF